MTRLLNATFPIIAILLMPAPAALDAADASAPARPNILVILADDLGYADVGFNGCRDIPTPNLDRLAKQSVRCTNGYVTHPFCSPTRAGLLTGRYQQRFGHENNPAWLPDSTTAGLPLSPTTLPQVLKTAGYVTGCVGKWHLGAHPQFHPNRRGFDEYFGLLVAGEKTNVPHDKLFWRSGGGAKFAVREGDWKLVGGEETATQLFNLAADVGENQDLADANPDVLNRLRQAYDDWNKDNIAPLFESPKTKKPKAAKKVRGSI